MDSPNRVVNVFTWAAGATLYDTFTAVYYPELLTFCESISLLDAPAIAIFDKQKQHTK
jgi:hypothetical protein